MQPSTPDVRSSQRATSVKLLSAKRVKEEKVSPKVEPTFESHLDATVFKVSIVGKSRHDKAARDMFLPAAISRKKIEKAVSKAEKAASAADSNDS